MAPPPARTTPRSDVRLVRRGDHLYVCTSTGTFRVATTGAAGDSDAVPLDALPEHVLEGLRRRGLVRDGEEGLSHPLYDRPAPPGTVTVADGPLGDHVAALLSRAGLRTVREDPGGNGGADRRRETTTATEAAATAATAPTDAAVLPLSAPEPALVRWTRTAIERNMPLVVHLSTPSRLLFATLRPPHTACPLCLVRRIRANHTWQAVAGLPLDALMGAAHDDAWPTATVAAGLLAHEVLTLGGPGPAPDSAVLTEVDHRSLERVQHATFHTPGCPACSSHTVHTVPPPEGGRGRDTPADDTGTDGVDVRESWERMRGAVDPLTGLVLELRVDETEAPGGTTYARTAGRTATKWFSPVSAEARGGAVKGDPVLARVCAVGETMERYAAGVYDPARLVRATFASLGDEAIDPRTLPLGSDKEYAAHTRYGPFVPDTEIDWVPGRSLTTGRTRYVPACAVYLPYRFPRGHKAWFDPISTGLAAGSGYHHAVLAGLLEVLERDATVVFWENRLVLPTLDLEGLEEGPERRIVQRLRSEGVQLTCKDLTTDLGVPVVGVRLVEGTRERPVVVHSARADLDPRAALLGALEEACLGRAGTRTWCAQLDAGARIPGPDDLLDSLRDFSLYYWAPERFRHLAFWEDGPLRPVAEARPSEGFRADIDEAVRRLDARGYEPVSVDITPIDVAECGVSVVRTLVPGLCPITLRSDFHRRGGPRVRQAPLDMGVRERALTEDELNPLPLPFL
ncbi:TOMM precursor leader peptide-binding protein [Streptomyces daliensis]|uniref:TOMM leader peptide-binding protein n=1 Tax=Streptomyces daliensis TaxID=299421 RepID=A0A8T4IKE7_9ACTN|nr:TOMM precursor leader peptide-binding protein [Streptomyces daliensis]